MNKEEFKVRLKKFAIDVVYLCKSLQFDRIVNSYINQLVRSSSSSAANYRAACRAKSRADFINKLRIVEEETDEAIFFLEMLEEFHDTNIDEFKRLQKEGNEILAMVVASINTALTNKNKIGNR